ncbi:MAG: sigma-70 family RNA polymerase sigma factor [Chitinophagaceae bacterium]
MEEDRTWGAIRNNQQDAFEGLYKNYYQFLFVFGFSLCADKEVTKDCIHEMLLEIWINRQQLPVVTHVGYYLKTYLKRKVYAELKKERHQATKNMEDADLPRVEYSYEDLLIHSESNLELMEKIRKALPMLTKSQAEIIKMKFYDGKSYEEIAAANATTPRTVYNQVYESLKTLRKILKVLLLLNT